jgi:hypothetical protein
MAVEPAAPIRHADALTNSSMTGRAETDCSMTMAWIPENSSGRLDQATAVESAPRHTDSSTVAMSVVSGRAAA